MIVTPPNAQSLPSSSKTDASASTPRVGPSGAPASDPSAVDGSEQPGGFGQILAERLDRGVRSDVATPDDRGPGLPASGLLIGPDGTPLATTNRLGDARAAGDAVDPDAAPTIGGGVAASKGSASGKADDTALLPDRKEGDDAAGNDLAAQLALVSQWAALPASDAQGADGASADGIDIQGKLDTVRGTPTKAAADAATLAAVRGDPSVAVASPLLASTAQQSLDRTLRSASTTTAAVTKAADAKAQDDASLAAASDRLSLADAILGKVDAAGAHGASDASTLANAFVTQVTAQVTNAQAAAQAAAQVANAQTAASLREPVGTPAWSHEVAQATLRIAANDLQGASLRLNPEHLGPLDVQVRVDNGVAHLAFNATHAETRQAIESSRTTLDQLFANQGLKIGDCAVGDSSARQRFDADAAAQGGAARDGGRRGAGDPSAADHATTTVTATVRRALGLVDTFA